MKKWTIEETNKVVELIKDGKNYSEISQIIGRLKTQLEGNYRILVKTF